MWSFILLAHPTPESPAHGEIGGAFATVFVSDPYAESAEAAARALVEGHGWQVEGLDSREWVELEDFPQGAPGRELYEQAALDGICATFHRWPADAPDAHDPDL